MWNSVTGQKCRNAVVGRAVYNERSEAQRPHSAEFNPPCTAVRTVLLLLLRLGFIGN